MILSDDCKEGRVFLKTLNEEYRYKYGTFMGVILKFLSESMKMIRAARIMTVLGLLTLWGPALAMEGSGTEEDPCIITNVEELQAMRNDLGAYYVLGNDIDASDTRNWNAGAGFQPVGSIFTGTLDGQRHTITGLYINRPSASRVGLFEEINYAEIKNVGLIDVEVYGYSHTGSLVGSNHWGSNVTCCYATGQMTISASGSNDAKSGGLVGVTAHAIISQCYSAVNVTALSSRKQLGGLCGYSAARSGYPPSLIVNCYSTGTVTSNGWKVGGLLGDADGINSTVSNCYSVGQVNGTHKKGLVGYNYSNPTIRDSYWDRQTSTCTSSYGGQPKTTAEMMQQATFVNWDFIDVWDIMENQTYPFLRFEYGDLVGLEIIGPNEVAENFSAGYKAIAHYESGSTKDVTDSADWQVEPNSVASIEAGLLTTEEIYVPQDITIYAQYTEGEVTVEAEKAVTIFAICPTGTALSFDGDDYVSVPDSASLRFTDASDVSISLWAKLENDQGWIIHNRNEPGGTSFWHIELRPDGTIWSQWKSGSDHATVWGSNDLTDVIEWHHIVAVYNGSGKNISIYVDGIFDGSSGNSQISGNFYEANTLKIGGYNTEWVNGTIDDVRIYDRALSAEEIRANMHTRLSGDELGLVGYWDFDEGEGQIVYDLSSNGNHGQLGSTPDADASDPAWVNSDAPIGICTLEELVERNLSDALDIKLDILKQLGIALAKEEAVVDMLNTFFKNRDFGSANKGDVAKAKQKIHSAMQHEEQAEAAVDKSIEKLEDASAALGLEPLVDELVQ